MIKVLILRSTWATHWAREHEALLESKEIERSSKACDLHCIFLDKIRNLNKNNKAEISNFLSKVKWIICFLSNKLSIDAHLMNTLLAFC